MFQVTCHLHKQYLLGHLGTDFCISLFYEIFNAIRTKFSGQASKYVDISCKILTLAHPEHSVLVKIYNVFIFRILNSPWKILRMYPEI